MRRAVFALALSTTACSTTHSLQEASHLPSRQGACSIGVASLIDPATGVDHALDLRDYLRTHGPCRRVTAVLSPDDDGVDMVITGKVTAQLSPQVAPPGMMLGAGLAGAGIGVALAGVACYTANAIGPPKPDSNGFISPSARASQKSLNGLGALGLAVGGGLTVAGISLMVIDAEAIREVSLDGRVDVEVTVLRKGRPVAELHEHDDVTARGSAADGQPESRSMPAASGPLYREVMARVFEHIAARVTDEIQTGDQGSASH